MINMALLSELSLTAAWEGGEKRGGRRHGFGSLNRSRALTTLEGFRRCLVAGQRAKPQTGVWAFAEGEKHRIVRSFFGASFRQSTMHMLYIRHDFGDDFLYSE